MTHLKPSNLQLFKGISCIKAKRLPSAVRKHPNVAREKDLMAFQRDFFDSRCNALYQQQKEGME